MRSDMFKKTTTRTYEPETPKPRATPPAGQTCGNCAYWFSNNGECRWYPPYVISGAQQSMWPKVKATDWCAQYKVGT